MYSLQHDCCIHSVVLNKKAPFEWSVLMYLEYLICCRVCGEGRVYHNRVRLDTSQGCIPVPVRAAGGCSDCADAQTVSALGPRASVRQPPWLILRRSAARGHRLLWCELMPYLGSGIQPLLTNDHFVNFQWPGGGVGVGVVQTFWGF